MCRDLELSLLLGKKKQDFSLCKYRCVFVSRDSIQKGAPVRRNSTQSCTRALWPELFKQADMTSVWMKKEGHMPEDGWQKWRRP